MNVAILIPAYNEEKTIGEIVKKCKKYGNVIVIDDASSDKTPIIAKAAGAVVISHKKNRGLGGALRTGFKEVLKTNAEIIITIDADGQHLPEDIPKFIEKVKEGYDFVLGQRNLKQYPLIKKVGNFILNYLTNLISGTKLRDTESGFRAFSRNALEKISLHAEKYEIAAEIIKEVGKKKIKYANVPVNSPIYVKGVRVMDGIKNFLYILRN